MSDVTGLGYIGIDATDLRRWAGFATEVLGLELAKGSDESQGLFLRADERAWRFQIRQSDHDGLAFVGWEVAGPSALDRISALLRSNGYEVTESPELAKARGVTKMIKCIDPTGISLEFFYGAFIPKEAFVSPLGYEFVTGELGLGHIVLKVENDAATRAFYLDLLGFQLSDIVEWNGGEVVFTHVNRRHHSLAFVEVPGADIKIAHFMLEVTNIDPVGRSLDKALLGAAKITHTMGRHVNDHMLSFYCETPSGFEVEFGTAGRTITPDWAIARYNTDSFWGHHAPAGE